MYCTHCWLDADKCECSLDDSEWVVIHSYYGENVALLLDEIADD